MRGGTTLGAVMLAVLLAPGAARAEEWIFFDPHPIHPAAGRGFCEAAGAHVHDYAPVDPAAFVLTEGLWIFVGDPVAFGYRGVVHRFDAGHVVPASGATVRVSSP